MFKELDPRHFPDPVEYRDDPFFGIQQFLPELQQGRGFPHTALPQQHRMPGMRIPPRGPDRVEQPDPLVEFAPGRLFAEPTSQTAEFSWIHGHFSRNGGYRFPVSFGEYRLIRSRDFQRRIIPESACDVMPFAANPTPRRVGRVLRFAALPVSPSPRLPVSPSPRLPVSPSPRLPVSPSPRLPVSPSPRLPVSPSPRLPISPSPHLPISPSPHLPIRFRFRVRGTASRPKRENHRFLRYRVTVTNPGSGVQGIPKEGGNPNRKRGGHHGERIPASGSRSNPEGR
jgi:hypothetical protein